MTTQILIPIEEICYEKSLQIRVIGCDGDHIDALKEAMQEGSDIPPIEVFQSEDGYYIGDGNHRFLAYQSLKKKEIPCIVFEGGRDAAFKRALGANSEHNALRRTNKDKRNAILRALDAYPNASLRELAKLCAVTHQAVAKIKKEVSTVDTPAKKTPTNSGQNGTQIDFFGIINRSFDTAYKGIETTLGDPAWSMTEISNEDKIHAIREIKRHLNDKLKEANKYEKSFLIAKQKEQEA